MKATCSKCSYVITEQTNIFEGMEASYICPICNYEGYCPENNEIKL